MNHTSIALRAWRSAITLNNAGVSLLASQGESGNLPQAKSLFREALNVVKVSCRYVEQKQQEQRQEVPQDADSFALQANAIIERAEATIGSLVHISNGGGQHPQQEGGAAPNHFQVLRSSSGPHEEEFHEEPLNALTMMRNRAQLVQIDPSTNMMEERFVPKTLMEQELELHSGFILFNFGMLCIHEVELYHSNGVPLNHPSLVTLQFRALSLFNSAHALFSKRAARQPESGILSPLSFCDDVAYIHTITLDKLAMLSNATGNFEDSIKAAACAEQMMARLQFIHAMLTSSTIAAAAPAA